jgi:hypothetical protein
MPPACEERVSNMSARERERVSNVRAREQHGSKMSVRVSA